MERVLPALKFFTRPDNKVIVITVIVIHHKYDFIIVIMYIVGCCHW